MEIIIAAILAVLAINHVDDTPVPNLYKQPDQTLTITGDPLPLKPLGWDPAGADVWQHYDPNQQKFKP